MELPENAAGEALPTAPDQETLRLRAVLAAAPDALLAVNTAGVIVLANAQADRLFGWAAAELIGKQVDLLVPDSVASRHSAHRAAYLADPRARPMGAGLRLSGRRRDGTTFPAEISLSAVADELDGVLILTAVRDISDRITLEESSRELEREAQSERAHRLESLGQLAGGVAHDFNNLLGVILNYSTLIERRVSDPTAVADIGEIRAAAERAASLTRQLLAFARQDIVRPELLDINEIVDGVGSMLARTIGESIDLRIVVGEGSLVAVADRHHVEQIILNLAINSRDAMPDGGTLTIATRQSTAADEIILEVTDTGTGMAAEVAARAFEPFFTTKEVGMGTGLGLSTVYGIVGHNQGSVALTSELGKGTVVTVRLPRATDDTTVKDTTVEVSQKGAERILLVEDEESLRVTTARILSEHGYDVVVAVDGIDALEIIGRSDDFALVVSDVAMPRMRGDEMERLLVERDPHVRMLFLTGHDSGSVSTHRRVLSKPVSESTLLHAIREILDD